MPNKFCPKCGAQGVELIDRFCAECHLKTHEIAKFPSKVKVDQCKHCNSLFLAGQWVSFDLQKVKKYIMKHIKTDLKNPSLEMNVLERKIVGTISGTSGNSILEQDFEIPYKVHLITCDTCMKLSAKYWQLKVQLRKKSSSNVKSFGAMMREFDIKKDFRKDTKEGPDFYFISLADTKEFIKRISKKYEVRPITSKRFSGFAKSGGKKIKYTYCLRV